MGRANRLKIRHDIARPHTALMTRAFFESNEITLVKQPPYSPDMNHLDRYIFRNMEFDRKDQHFAIKNEVELYVQQFMAKKMTRAKLSRELERLKDDLLLK